MQNILFFLTFSTFIFLCYSDAVCDENTFITELRQDIADNKMLDCLRVVQDAPTDKEETEEMRRKRIAAAWDSDCSFEADYDWVSPLKDLYGMEKGLVDVKGDSVKEDFPDQADMCELVRGMIASGRIPGAKADVKEIESDAVDGIDCPGDGDKGQSEICAASGGSPGQKYSWYIMLDGMSFNIGGFPAFIMEEEGSGGEKKE